MLRHSIALLLCLVVGAAACDDGIASASRLRRLRLLAVQAEPPNPGLGQTTWLRPLVYVPPGESVTYDWSWCPLPTSSEDGYVCPVDQAAVDTLAARTGLASVPPLWLGTDASVAFTNPFPADLLAKLCQGDSATTALFTENASVGKNQLVYDCTLATLPMQIMLTIRGSTVDTGVVSLRLPVDASTPGNHNPLVTGITVASSEPIARNTDVKLLAGIDPAQAEIGPDGQPEALTLSWFAEGGGFVHKTTSWGPNTLDKDGQPLPFQALVENTWTTPKADDYTRASSLLIVVARDGRGGMGWSQAEVSLEATP